MRRSETKTTTTDFQVEHNGLSTTARLEYAGNIDDFPEGVVLAPGLGSRELAGLRMSLAQLGHAVISFEQPRARFLGQLRDVAELRAGVIEEVIGQAERRYGLGKIALVGHSLAALDSAEVAGRVGERLSSVEYMAGAGFSGDGFFETAWRISSDMWAETNWNNLRDTSGTVQYAGRRPIQFLLEGVYGSSNDIRPKVEQLARDGLNSGALQFESDVIFSPHVVATRMAHLAIRKVITSETAHACHGSPLDDPEGTALVLHNILGNRHPDAPVPDLQAA